MKIIITRRGSFEWADGINIFTLSLAEQFLLRGHQVICLETELVREAEIRRTFACAAYPQFQSLLPSRSASYLASGLGWLWHGRAALERHQPDIVLVNGAVPVWFPSPSIITSHDLERRLPKHSQLRVAYKRFCYRRCDRVVATCSELRDALANELRLDRATIHVIPTCVHLPQHSPTPFAAREPAILHMGTARYKRAEDSLAAFGRLADPSVTLYITGSPNESVTTALRTLPSVLQDKVRLLGVVPAAELTALLHRVRCVSVPSHYDIPVLSPTVLESMAARTPVVCSPSISRDLIAPGTNCRVAHSPDELATAWRELLDDETAWKQSSAAGYDTVQRFTPAAVADAYARVAATLLRPG